MYPSPQLLSLHGIPGVNGIFNCAETEEKMKKPILKEKLFLNLYY